MEGLGNTFIERKEAFEKKGIKVMLAKTKMMFMNIFWVNLSSMEDVWTLVSHLIGLTIIIWTVLILMALEG